ncbi:CDK-activating kinase assembly [Babesia ovata]|uniref:CDK-activating kinase assembly n=1 Tax=Babesia ovata TaxID=189622 RepID=A0A2H6KCF5_9APIC|nr:CDK-activating kinase assembly [Babesia ovata]GBE60678.1 CDK-activating kinase assembly [Babesia ovata]
MDNECPICLDVITPLSEKKMLVSKVCDHKIASFALFDITQAYYSTLKEARKRVLQVYNDTRANFKDTPEYNKFLEDRETMINTLALGRNDLRGEQVEAELKNYERQRASRISENIAAQQNELRKRVKHIVETEKTFYEMVDKGAPFNLWKVDDLVHTLQRTHASFFAEKKEVVSSTGECKPLNAAIRNDTDIPRRMLASRDEVLACDIAGGYSSALVAERCRMQVDLMLLWNLV